MTTARWLPIALIGALMAAIIYGGSNRRIESVRCEQDLPVAAADVVMLGAGWCGYCNRARAFFDEKSVAYCEYDIETTQRGAELYQRSRVGVIPVIYVRDEVIVGFNRDELLQTLIAENVLSFDEY